MKKSILTITFILLIFISCKQDDNQGIEEPKASIELVSGDNQFGIINTQIAEPIVLIVKNELGEPLSGVQVLFEISEGALSSSTLTTNNDGKVSVNWTLGNSLGIQTLTVKSFGKNGTDLINSPIQINATAISPCITKINSTEFLIPNPSIVRSSINVVENLTITDVNVTLNIIHSNVAAVKIALESPTGVTVILYFPGGDGGSLGFVNTTFDDDASVMISNGLGTFTGSFIPDNSLSVLNDSSSSGEWTLIITSSGGNEGTLLNWSLELCLE